MRCNQVVPSHYMRCNQVVPSYCMRCNQVVSSHYSALTFFVTVQLRTFLKRGLGSSGLLVYDPGVVCVCEIVRLHACEIVRIMFDVRFEDTQVRCKHAYMYI